MQKYAGTGTRITQFDPTGMLKAGPVYVSPDPFPTSISTGTASTITLTAGYVGSAVYFDPSPSAIASYTLTFPASAPDNTIIEIFFGGQLTSGTVVTSLTLLPNTGQDFIQTSAPTTAVAGDHLSYRKYNNHWYRRK